MKVAVFGAGYVGCVTASCLSSLGHHVWLVEPSETKLADLKAGNCPIVEPEIDRILPEQIKKGAVIPLADPTQAIAATDLALICVGTPSLANGMTDIRQVQTVFGQILAALKTRTTPYTIALRSTIPYMLLTKEILADFQQGLSGRYGKNVFFALNPEFLREGSSLKDFMHPPFIVAGSDHAPALETLKTLYKDIQAPFQAVSLGCASLLKYACNAFHAVKIVFTNELASLAPLFEADAKQTMELFCKDDVLNISPAYLRPGFAYGGSCLPKDLKTLSRLAAVTGVATPLLDSLEKSNNLLIDRTIEAISGLGLRKIGLMGLTFKAGTDDFRNSPLVEIAERLLGKGLELAIFDPDIDMQKIHGQNLRYIQQKMRHLAQLLSADFAAHVKNSELLVIGKLFPALDALIAQVPADRQILDLTRKLAPRAAPPRIIHLEMAAAE